MSFQLRYVENNPLQKLQNIKHLPTNLINYAEKEELLDKWYYDF